jgi:hypothetical protein
MRNSVIPILTLVYSAETVQSDRMGEGRLIRVRAHRDDSRPVAYVVAIPEKEKAILLIRQKFEAPDIQIDDLGGVSEALLRTLSVSEGDFVRIEGVKHVAQQQQQQQPQVDKASPSGLRRFPGSG